MNGSGKSDVLDYFRPHATRGASIERIEIRIHCLALDLSIPGTAFNCAICPTQFRAHFT